MAAVIISNIVCVCVCYIQCTQSMECVKLHQKNYFRHTHKLCSSKIFFQNRKSVVCPLPQCTSKCFHFIDFFLAMQCPPPKKVHMKMSMQGLSPVKTLHTWKLGNLYSKQKTEKQMAFGKWVCILIVVYASV